MRPNIKGGVYAPADSPWEGHCLVCSHVRVFAREQPQHADGLSVDAYDLKVTNEA